METTTVGGTGAQQRLHSSCDLTAVCLFCVRCRAGKLSKAELATLIHEAGWSSQPAAFENLWRKNDPEGQGELGYERVYLILRSINQPDSSKDAAVENLQKKREDKKAKASKKGKPKPPPPAQPAAPAIAVEASAPSELTAIEKLQKKREVKQAGPGPASAAEKGKASKRGKPPPPPSAQQAAPEPASVPAAPGD